LKEALQRLRLIAWGSCLLFGIALPGSLGAQDAWGSLQQRLVELFEENRGAMVRVHAAFAPKEEGNPAQEIIGSGFFISRQGLVLTIASIVNQPDRVWVEHRGVEYAAELVGLDRASNLALLRLDTQPEQFGFFHLADSADLPNVGQMVVRLSLPLNFDPSPRMGMVAGFESAYGGQLFPCKYMRVAMGAGPGEGGAAYLDLAGRLVGIHVFTLPEIDSSYVLPARAALRIRDDLLFSGEVSFGWMGFQVREATSVADGRRLLLDTVDRESPAEAAGLLSGDVLLKIGDYGVREIDDLRNAMFYSRVGQFVEVEVRREGVVRTFTVKLAKRPANEPLQVVRPVPRSPQSIPPVREENGEAPTPSPLLPSPPLVPEEEPRRDVPVQGGRGG
jgi:serine protease Do